MNVAISRSHRSGSCKQDDDPKLLILRHGRLALLTKRISPNYWDVIAFTMIVADFVVIPNGSRGNGRGAEAAAYLCKKLHGDAGRGSGGTLTRIASPRYSRGQAAGEADALVDVHQVRRVDAGDAVRARAVRLHERRDVGARLV